MTQTFALAFCLITQLGAATPPPTSPVTPPPKAAPAATPAPVPATATVTPPATAPVYSTTGGPCSDPLCQGLVGAGAGVAGLSAIAGITVGAVAAARQHAAVATAPPPAFKLGVSFSTAAPVIFNREQEGAPVAEEGSNWVVPLLLGLLLICCIFGISAYFYMNGKRKRSAKTREIAPTPMPELAPLMPAPSYSVEGPAAPPVVVSRSVSFEAAPPAYGYAMAPPVVQTVAQPYAMAAPAYSMAAPTAVQAFAPTYAGAMDCSGCSAVPQGYAMGSVPQGYATGYPAGAPGYFPGYAEPTSIF